MKITKDDIDRNFEHVKRGEALDMPLAVLDGELKKKCINGIPDLLERPDRKAYYLNVTKPKREAERGMKK